MQSRRTVTGGVRRPRWALTALLAMALGVAVLATGCTPAEEPVRDAREALGTVVTITAYGEDAAQVEMAVEDAYAAMAEVERALNVYGETGAPCGSAASLNLMPHEWNPLPEEAQEVLARTAELDVGGQFSPSLFGVQELYDFEGGGRVPDAEELAPAVEAAATFETREADGIVDGRFAPQGGAETTTSAEAVPVGVDFGGAAKGLGLDRAAAALRESGAVDAAIISAGSTTIAFGEKPDGSPWKIGIEDPRDPEVVVSVVEGPGDVIVSTSGDYQRYFEEDGRAVPPHPGSGHRRARTRDPVAHGRGHEHRPGLRHPLDRPLRDGARGGRRLREAGRTRTLRDRQRRPDADRARPR